MLFVGLAIMLAVVVAWFMFALRVK